MSAFARDHGYTAAHEAYNSPTQVSPQPADEYSTITIVMPAVHEVSGTGSPYLISATTSDLTSTIPIIDAKDQLELRDLQGTAEPSVVPEKYSLSTPVEQSSFTVHDPIRGMFSGIPTTLHLEIKPIGHNLTDPFWDEPTSTPHARI